MELVTEALKWTGLDPALFSFALVLAIILRFARGMTHWVGDGWTFLAAIALAVGGALVKASEHEPWRVDAINALGLLAAVLILQGVLQKLAEKVPFLPNDKQWAPPSTSPPPSNQ